LFTMTVFIAALFTIAEIWKQPKCPEWMDGWMDEEVVVGIQTRTHTQTHTHTHLSLCHPATTGLVTTTATAAL